MKRSTACFLTSESVTPKHAPSEVRIWSVASALAKYAQARASCEARAYSKGGAVDAACGEKAAAKLERAIAKAEAKGDCNDTGDGSGLEALADEFVSDLGGILDPPPLVCCASALACIYAADQESCTLAINGTIGAAGTVCSGAGGCVSPPAEPGPCCEEFFTSRGIPVACAQAAFDANNCPSESAIGGTLTPSAICRPSGLCVVAP
jgi:hypothetical protein